MPAQLCTPIHCSAQPTCILHRQENSAHLAFAGKIAVLLSFAVFVLTQGAQLQVHSRSGRLSGLRKRKSAAALVQVRTAPIKQSSPCCHSEIRTWFSTLPSFDNNSKVETLFCEGFCKPSKALKLEHSRWWHCCRSSYRATRGHLGRHWRGRCQLRSQVAAAPAWALVLRATGARALLGTVRTMATALPACCVSPCLQVSPHASYPISLLPCFPAVAKETKPTLICAGCATTDGGSDWQTG